jgi:hypothetical protein
MAVYLAIFGCAVLILIEEWFNARYLLKGMAVLAEQARTNHAEVMCKLGIQPPLADEKPQAVQVTIKASPTSADWAAFMDFEASQQKALDEFKEQ